MIIEVGQVWKKPVDREVVVTILKVKDMEVTVSLGYTIRQIELCRLKDAFIKHNYLLCTNLTKALI